jgi:hypothetical protein
MLFRPLTSFKVFFHSRPSTSLCTFAHLLICGGRTVLNAAAFNAVASHNNEAFIIQKSFQRIFDQTKELLRSIRAITLLLSDANETGSTMFCKISTSEGRRGIERFIPFALTHLNHRII